eukprot:TRINITY_DN1662_c0_g1_i1.p1 TRINITY_DN1662_c0_g1~~TRINITY_DN1662_c0_g1_i1.p1  ORF type:complete len:196 (-),score=12.01 TRINITY_DN1662_c0_g1_i1:64-651(-)
MAINHFLFCVDFDPAVCSDPFDTFVYSLAEAKLKLEILMSMYPDNPAYNESITLIDKAYGLIQIMRSCNESSKTYAFTKEQLCMPISTSIMKVSLFYLVIGSLMFWSVLLSLFTLHRIVRNRQSDRVMSVQNDKYIKMASIQSEPDSSYYVQEPNQSSKIGLVVISFLTICVFLALVAVLVFGLRKISATQPFYE